MRASVCYVPIILFIFVRNNLFYNSLENDLLVKMSKTKTGNLVKFFWLILIDYD